MSHEWDIVHDFELKAENVDKEYAIGISLVFKRKGRSDKLWVAGEEFFCLSSLVD